MTILADLHNHSCLSPCASLEMSPSLLARMARERGLGLVALTDHNSALNCPAFEVACRREGIAPLFGMEACSAEEVHVLCLFGDVAGALGFGLRLRGLLMATPHDPKSFGDQIVVDADEVVQGSSYDHLGAALNIGFDELCAEASALGAVVIPAHVDRPFFSVSSQLGFLPPGPYDAVESMREPPLALAGPHAAISGSDAHDPELVGRRPFSVELPDGVLAERGRTLLEALRRSLRGGLVQASWVSSRKRAR